jgi:hypothetical protein
MMLKVEMSMVTERQELMVNQVQPPQALETITQQQVNTM